MIVPPDPPDETSRLASLYKYDILDTEAEKDFDDVVNLAASVCQTPISTITLIDKRRQWFKARLGVESTETPREQAFCAHAILDDAMLVVPDATRDVRFNDNPLVTGRPDIRFYAGMPLTMPDGSRLGTLCVIDRKPRELNEVQKNCLRILGQQVVHQLELRLKIKELDHALGIVEQQKAALQKLNDAGTQLLSVIGHDLRSPLASVVTLMEVCGMKEMTPEEFNSHMSLIKAKAYSAMDMLSDLLEWAEDQFMGREMHREEMDFRALAAHVIEENRAALDRKGNSVANNVPPGLRIMADRRSLDCMTRNLLLNANKFTEKGLIEIAAENKGNQTRVWVSDNGIGMDAVQLEKLFDPLSRSSTPGTHGEKGSGLGLQLCKEFAKRQGGDIGVESKPGKGSRFYFTISRT